MPPRLATCMTAQELEEYIEWLTERGEETALTADARREAGPGVDQHT